MSYSPKSDRFLPRLSQLITIAALAGKDAYGAATYVTPAKQYHARIQGDSRAIYTAPGEVIQSTNVVYLHPRALDGSVLTAINTDMQLTLPDGTQPRILTASSEPDGDGLTVYYKLTT